VAYGFKIGYALLAVYAEGLAADKGAGMTAVDKKRAYPVHKTHGTGIDTDIPGMFGFVIGVNMFLGAGKGIGIFFHVLTAKILLANPAEKISCSFRIVKGTYIVAENYAAQAR
jgi:hypothetical protein